jgi:hypothetical protein
LGGLIPRRRLIDARAAVLTGTGVDPHVRRADHTVLPRGRRLDRQPVRQQRLVEPTANVGEHVRTHAMRLGAIHPDRCDPTGIQPGQVGPSPAPDRLVGPGQLWLPSRQRPQHARRDGRPSTRAKCGEALGERAGDGRAHGRPRQRLGPWADGMRFRDAVCLLHARSTSSQPMLEVASERHRRPS